MKRYLLASLGIAVFVTGGLSESRAQSGNLPRNSNIRLGVGLVGSNCDGCALAVANGFDRAVPSDSTTGKSDPYAPQEVYAGRVAYWVPGGGEMTSRTIPAKPLIANSSNSSAPANNTKQTAEARMADERAIAAARALAGTGGFQVPTYGTDQPMMPVNVPRGYSGGVSLTQAANPNLPYYANYGFGNNYYTPTYPSYAPYAQPGVSGGYPVPSVTYPGGVVMQQSGTGSSPYAFTPASAGYLSYSNNAAYYGQGMTSVSMPGYVTYGQNSQAALTPPGYYANYLPTPTINYNMGPGARGMSVGSGSYYAPMAPSGR